MQFNSSVDKYSVKTESWRGCMQLCYLLSQDAELARSFSKNFVQNHQTFQNSCEESSKVHVRNHQDNNFLINVACRSDANLIKLDSVTQSACAVYSVVAD